MGFDTIEINLVFNTVPPSNDILKSVVANIQFIHDDLVKTSTDDSILPLDVEYYNEDSIDIGGGTWCPETICPETIRPETMCPKTIRPEIIRPGDNLPRETICPGDNMPRRQTAPETTCPVDNPPQRQPAPRQYASKTMCPGDNPPRR